MYLAPIRSRKLESALDYSIFMVLASLIQIPALFPRMTSLHHVETTYNGSGPEERPTAYRQERLQSQQSENPVQADIVTNVKPVIAL